MTKKFNSIQSTHTKKSSEEENKRRLFLRTFYEEGRLKKLDESTHCVNQARWIWAAIAVLTIICAIGFIRLEFLATEVAKRTDAFNLIHNSMTHFNEHIKKNFIKNDKKL